MQLCVFLLLRVPSIPSVSGYSLIGIEVKNLRTDLALRIAVRRYLASGGREMPVEAEANPGNTKQAADKITVLLATQLLDKALPVWRQIHAALVVQHVAVMAALAVLALLTEKTTKLFQRPTTMA